MSAASTDAALLLSQIAACTRCQSQLPFAPKPILQFHPSARILVAGQAPGLKAHGSGVAFDDASGARLREWLGLSREQFYDSHTLAILPMGFCYAGKGKSGDLPPRPECAPLWRQRVLDALTQVQLTLVLGKYALAHHMPQATSLTQAVRDWKTHWPQRLVLPHPSPRNNIWLSQNPWFEAEVLPALRKRVQQVLTD